jgi:hypothetical protein
MWLDLDENGANVTSDMGLCGGSSSASARLIAKSAVVGIAVVAVVGSVEVGSDPPHMYRSARIIFSQIGLV